MYFIVTNKSNQSIDLRAKGHLPNNLVFGQTIEPGTYTTLGHPACPVVKIALFSSIGTLCVKCNATENTVVDLYLDKPVYIQKNISNTDNMEMLKDFIPVVSLGQLDSPNFSFDTVYDLVEPYNGTVRMLQFTRRSLYGRTGSFN